MLKMSEHAEAQAVKRGISLYSIEEAVAKGKKYRAKGNAARYYYLGTSVVMSFETVITVYDDFSKPSKHKQPGRWKQKKRSCKLVEKRLMGIR